jgi:cell division protein FtsN
MPPDDKKSRRENDLSTPVPPPPGTSSTPRIRGKLVVAVVLIALALLSLIVVERLRDRTAAPAAPHEPAQALITPPQAPAGNPSPALPSDTSAANVPPPPPIIVNEPDRLPPPASARPRAIEAVAPETGYLVQAGMFTSATNAQALQKKLARAGIDARVETRVQLGPFKDKAEAERALAKLRKLGISAVLLPAK